MALGYTWVATRLGHPGGHEAASPCQERTDVTVPEG
jgi:hypothetical protein